MTLKPCPFCGNTTTLDDTCTERDSHREFYYLFCGRCEASGPTDYERGKAIELWNRRLQPEEGER